MAEQRDISIVQPTDVSIADEHQLPDLSERESLWLSHYLGDHPLFHATNAALALGYAYESAKVIGYRIKHLPSVQAHIRAYIADLGVTRERVAANLAAIANADWSGMTELKMRNGVVVDARMDLTSVVKANELLGKELGMFTEKVDVDVSFVPLRLVGVPLDDL